MYQEFGAGKKAPDAINVLVSLPKGSRMEFGFEGVLKLKALLPVPFMLDADYGTVPQTRCDNSQPLGVVILGGLGLPAGTLIECRPIGVLRLSAGGIPEDKILAVPLADQRFKTVTDLEDLPDHIPLEVSSYYKQYAGANPVGWKSSAAAKKVIIHAIELYRKRGNNV